MRRGSLCAVLFTLPSPRAPNVGQSRRAMWPSLRYFPPKLELRDALPLLFENLRKDKLLVPFFANASGDAKRPAGRAYSPNQTVRFRARER